MQAARWADDVRSNDKAQNRPPWHFINIPFKPEGQPASVQTREPEAVNILTAMAENQRIVKNETDPERMAIALAWFFHLVGDIHQPLHTAQLFTVDYPNGDRGGNEICVRVTQAGQSVDLHRFWDGVITSSSNLTRLRNEATALRNRQEFQRSQLAELANTDFESWAKESFEIATKIAYRNDGRIGILRVEYGLHDGRSGSGTSGGQRCDREAHCRSADDPYRIPLGRSSDVVNSKLRVTVN
jgi:S1/P1 Nuclease